MRLLPLLLTALIACRTNDKVEEEEVIDTGGVTEVPDVDADGYNAEEDCDDNNSVVNPGAEEICDGVDNNCDGEVDEGVTTTFYEDIDGDGFGDAGSTVQACEIPAGFVATGTDCDDFDPEVYPSAPEQCDGLDNDCDGEVDEDVRDDWYADADGDGFGDADSAFDTCDPPPGYVTDDTDCDDTESLAFPGGEEVCDEVDNDCDGTVDENVTTTYYQDTDGDGFGVADITTAACDLPTGYAAVPGDCDDADGAISPNATEICDDIDNDCDGDADSDAIDRATFYADSDSDGFGDAGTTVTDCDAPSGYLTDATDCDDADSAIHPDAAEVCDSADNDCDGDTDEGVTTTYYADADGDGFGLSTDTTEDCDLPSGYAEVDDDCDDADAAIHPDAAEVCDDIDNDCDGDIDTDATDMSTWYADNDGDGYGGTSATQACDAPSGFVGNADDCDDGESLSNPGESEVCDEIDNDCDGDTDEGLTTTFYFDYDGDGYGDADTTTQACTAPSGYLTDDTDCDDAESLANPGESEVCDEIDNDCDGDIDEGVTESWYLDTDGDGYGDDGVVVEACEAPTTSYVGDGGDCDDSDTAYNPGATEGCDGEDYNCDGDVDNDADGDGYADITCGGDDCDDADAAVLPEIGGECALGEGCLDVQDNGYDDGDGTYTIDPDGYGTGEDPFDVHCDMTTDGGGWTLLAVNAGGGSWSTTNVIDDSTIGSLSLTADYKSEAWSVVLFTDVMFDDGTDYAIYDSVDGGTQAWHDFQSAIPVHNCGTTSGYSYTMSTGTFSGGSLCNTNLYIHPIDEDGGYNSTCSATATYANNAYGPTWSVYNNNGCPLDDPSGTGFVSYSSATPWGSTLMMLVR